MVASRGLKRLRPNLCLEEKDSDGLEVVQVDVDNAILEEKNL